MVLRDADLLEGVVGDNGDAILDDEEFSSLPPLLFEGVEEDFDEELEVDEGISNKDIAVLLGEANQGVQGVDLGSEENDLPPLIPIEEEEEPDSEEEENENCSESDQGSSGYKGGDAPSLVS